MFDGICNLCNAAVQFIIKHEKNNDFFFAALQSDTANDLLQKFSIKPGSINSFVYIEKNKIYFKSTAALKVARHLKSPWNYWYGFIIVPAFIRDLFYDVVARTRYNIFGKRNECMVPSPEIKSKFLDQNSQNH